MGRSATEGSLKHRAQHLSAKEGKRPPPLRELLGGHLCSKAGGSRRGGVVLTPPWEVSPSRPKEEVCLHVACT